ncbi:GcrA family cell cycle regulator [Oceanibium sediminis]|uniref:GcrA family cell cycle regulator n=1 Tax=Oceanibium sediminis TaxID=2026339 RepID=UPI000DD4DFA8|nr:GcrA family cell cycle regulator [Oceanibium sediminis]
MSWTDERVETLKTMWGEGKSASQIAKELGGVTRNAVIGKVHRLGLSNRTQAPKTSAAPKAEEPAAAAAPAAAAKPADPPKPKAPPREAPAKEAAPKPVAVKDPLARPNKPIITAGQPLPPQPSQSEISEEQRANLAALEKRARKLTLLQLTERTCKWPIGDPATDDFWFCGHPTQPGKPYCETHVSVALQPMSSRRDRRSSR